MVGALNWLLIGLFDYNLVSSLFDGISPLITKGIYILVGICGLISLGYLTKDVDK